MLESSFKNLAYKNEIWTSRDEEYVSYPKNGNALCAEVEDDSYWFYYRNKVILELAVRFSYGETFVDIGGGNGYVAVALQNAGFDVYMIEPGVEGIVLAKHRGLRKLIHSTFNEDIFIDSSITNAGLFDVLEHISDDFGFLKKLHKKMTTGGKLFVSVPAYNQLWSDNDVHAGHYRRFNKNQIVKLLDNSGFRVIYFSYFFSVLPPLIFFFRRLPYLLFMRRSGGKPKQSGHKPSNRFTRFLINFFCKREMSHIQKGKKILFGSSCFVVAVKV